MPKFYCDYCDTHLTHDSPSVRKTHCQGRKHKENVKIYYQKWMEDQAQNMIDATAAAFKAGKIAVPPGKGAAIPPPDMGGPPNAMGPPRPMGPGPMSMGSPMGGPMMPRPMMGMNFPPSMQRPMGPGMPGGQMNPMMMGQMRPMMTQGPPGPR